MNHESAIIFDIQRFSLHDGPGVRTTVFFKGCPLRCRWCQNPESQSPAPEMAFYLHRCIGCFSCRAACREGAVTESAEARIDYGRCTTCGACAEACQTGALRRIGADWTVDALYDELLRDRDFFRDSGGGVTLSGGEPMTRPSFIAPLCARLSEAGIHVTVETCGYFQADALEAVSCANLVYFDLKHADDGAHRKLTGRGNETILKNFAELARRAVRLQPRMPVVPGFNDDAGNIGRTAGVIKSAGLGSIHCLPYQDLCEDKLKRINTRQKALGITPPSTGDMERVGALFRREGIEAIIYL